MLPVLRKFCIVIFITFIFTQIAPAQKVSGAERERGRHMLKTIANDIKKNYYDPSLRGIDLDARIKKANEAIDDAVSIGQIMGIIAQVTLEFNDSHTRFMPPAKANPTEYGWTPQMIGDQAFVIAVKPKSDAEAKGLKVGDQILAVDKTQIDRGNLWQMKYLYYTLRPQPGMRLTIRRPDGKEEELIVMAKVRQGKKVMDLTGGADVWDLIREGEREDWLSRHRYMKVGDIFIWKMPQFDLTESGVDEMMDKVRDCKDFILDLRGNGGGAAKTLGRMVGHFFDKDIKIADLKGRKEMDPQMAKSRGSKIFKGRVIVLIDSESGSSAEMFARIIQIEQRGVVLGDRSAGAVMMSRHYSYTTGIDTVAFFGASITIADVIMSDGKSLENIGVLPNKLVIPTGRDLAEQKDPALSYAAELLSAKLDPAEAGKMFPIEWGR